jgi:hypothetical protein
MNRVTSRSSIMSSCHAEKMIGSLLTMTHDRYGRTTQYTNGSLSHRVSSTGAPQPDGSLNKAARMKIRYYRQIYANRTDPIVFLPIVVSTSGRVYEAFTRLFFLHAHREASILAGELPQESEQFRFLRSSRLANLKDSVGLILSKTSAMRLLFPSICLRGLSYLYLAFLTLVECLLFLINLWS